MSIQSKYLLPSKSIFLMPLWLVASFHTQKHCPSLKKIGIQVMCKSLVSTKRIYRNLQKRSKKVQGPWKTIQTPKHSNQNDAQKKPSSVTSLPPPRKMCVFFPKKRYPPWILPAGIIPVDTGCGWFTKGVGCAI